MSSNVTSTLAVAPVTSAGSLSFRSGLNFSRSARDTFISAEAAALNPLRSPSTLSIPNVALPSAPPAEKVFSSVAAAPAVFRHAVRPTFRSRSARRLPIARSSLLKALGLMPATERSPSATWPIWSEGVFAGARTLERLTDRQRSRPRRSRLSTALLPRFTTIGVAPARHADAVGFLLWAPLPSSAAAPADGAIRRSRTTGIGAKRMAAHPTCGRGGPPYVMRPASSTSRRRGVGRGPMALLSKVPGRISLRFALYTGCASHQCGGPEDGLQVIDERVRFG